MRFLSSYPPRTYLKLVDEVRAYPEPYHLLASAGGISFLHALGPSARALTLIDTDPDVLSFSRLLATLIVESRSAQEFLSFLSGRTAPLRWWENTTLGAQVDHQETLSKKEVSEDLVSLYAHFFGPTSTQPPIRYFEGDGAAPSWRFGAGALMNEDSFLTLRTTIKEIPVAYLLQSFDDLNYERFTERGAPQLMLIAENEDALPQNPRDAIARRIIQTAKTPVKFLSWIRRLDVVPISLSNEDLSRKVLPWTKKKRVTVAGSFPLLDCSKEALEALEVFPYSNLESLLENLPYGGDLLVLYDEGKNEKMSSLLIKEVLNVVVPSFKRIMIVSNNLPEDVLTWCQEAGLQMSASVISIEWTGSLSVSVWELRGAY